MYSETVLDRRKKDDLQLTLSCCGLTAHYYYSFLKLFWLHIIPKLLMQGRNKLKTSQKILV